MAVSFGAGFAVVQLRQNARPLEAQLRKTRSEVSISLIERITDLSFPQRRTRLREIVRRFRETGWKDAFESPDDFEIRNFAYPYEPVGVRAKHGLVDIDILVDTLRGPVVRDGQVFEPHAQLTAKRYAIGIAPHSTLRVDRPRGRTADARSLGPAREPERFVDARSSPDPGDGRVARSGRGRRLDYVDRTQVTLNWPG
jgi:hypothetical protein